MSPELRNPDAGERWPRLWRISVSLSILLVGLVVLPTVFYQSHYEGRLGPEQPIPFSHRVHSGVKEISCVMCHPGVLRAARAGVPPVETCMLCHEHIIVTYPPVAKLRAHWFDEQPIRWTRVNNLPELVYFDHAIHIETEIDCGACHGDVKGMDRIEQVHRFRMGWCLECHRRLNASHDCFTCHR